jgi:hypothetical protein
VERLRKNTKSSYAWESCVVARVQIYLISKFYVQKFVGSLYIFNVYVWEIVIATSVVILKESF